MSMFQNFVFLPHNNAADMRFYNNEHRTIAMSLNSLFRKNSFKLKIFINKFGTLLIWHDKAFYI